MFSFLRRPTTEPTTDTDTATLSAAADAMEPVSSGLTRLQLSDDDVDVDDGSSTERISQMRPSRMLRVSGLDGRGLDVQVHSRDSIGMIKCRISQALGVHEDLQEVFDADAEEPFDNDMELPESTQELTLLSKTPDLYKVTPGPPLNCRAHADKKGKVLESFKPGDIVKVIGDKVKGGIYADNHHFWLPVLIEVNLEQYKDHEPKEGDQMEGDQMEGDQMEEGKKVEEVKMSLTKAWTACGSETDQYLSKLTEEEEQDYYLRG